MALDAETQRREHLLYRRYTRVSRPVQPLAQVRWVPLDAACKLGAAHALRVERREYGASYVVGLCHERLNTTSFDPAASNMRSYICVSGLSPV